MGIPRVWLQALTVSASGGYTATDRCTHTQPFPFSASACLAFLCLTRTGMSRGCSPLSPTSMSTAPALFPIPKGKDSPAPGAHTRARSHTGGRAHAGVGTGAAGLEGPRLVPAGPAPFPCSFPSFNASAQGSVPQENNSHLTPFPPENKQGSVSDYH